MIRLENIVYVIWGIIFIILFQQTMQLIAQEVPGIEIRGKGLNFGTVEIGGKVVKSIDIFNPGTLELVLEKITFEESDAFSASPIRIPPQKTVPLYVAFSPGKIGPAQTIMKIRHNALIGNTVIPGTPYIDIKLSGKGKKTVTVIVTKDRIPQKGIVVRISNIAADQSGDSGKAVIELTNPDIDLNAALEMVLMKEEEVVFTGTIELSQGSLFNIDIGKAQMLLFYESRVLMATEEVDFQTEKLFYTRRKKFTLKNSGTLTLHNLGISLAPGHPAYKLQLPPNKNVITPGESLDFTVSYTPGLFVGNEGELCITCNELPVHSYRLTGTVKFFPYYAGLFYKWIYPTSEWLLNREIQTGYLGIEALVEFPLADSPFSFAAGTNLFSWGKSFNNNYDKYEVQLLSGLSINAQCLWAPYSFLKFFLGADLLSLNWDRVDDVNQGSFKIYTGQNLLDIRAGIYFYYSKLYICINYEDIIQNFSSVTTAYTGQGFRITGGYHYE